MRKLALIVFLSVLWVTNTYADSLSVGDMADWVMGPINGLGKVFGYICLIGGIGMILGSFLQYKAHRENPSQVRLTTPVFLFIMGVLLILLPFVGVLVGYKADLIPYY